MKGVYRNLWRVYLVKGSLWSVVKVVLLQKDKEVGC